MAQIKIPDTLTDEQINSLPSGVTDDRLNQLERLSSESASANVEAGKSVGRRFLSELPKQAVQSTLGNVARFGVSALAAPVDLVRGAMGKQPMSGKVDFPGLDPFQTFQAEGAENISRLQGETTPDTLGTYASALKPFAEVPLAGLETLGAINIAGNIPDAVGGTVDVSRRVLKTRASAKDTKLALEALAPEERGKAFTSRLLSRARSGKSLSDPDRDTVNLAESLGGVVKNPKNPAKDIKALQDEFRGVSTKLDDVLTADKSIVSRAEAKSVLNKLMGEKPREFIGENGKLYDDAVEFAKQLVDNNPGKAQGIRNARIQFDAQARTQYPSAFQGGRIDVKSPAGRAIKDVRDALNEFLYQRTPAGSQVRELIKKEADIYRALDIIVPKYQKYNRLSVFGKAQFRYPKTTTAAEVATGLGALGVGYQGLRGASRSILGD